MKNLQKNIKATSYVAGIFAIAAAMLLVVFLLMSVLGLIHPRKERISLQTENITKIYDGTPLQGSAPILRYGRLHDGHTIAIRRIPEYSEVGEYENAPEIVILDATGADVTNQYDINYDYGTIRIQGRRIILTCIEKSKVYDGMPLTCNQASLGGGTLLPGHTLVSEGGNTLLLPGKEKSQPAYRILSESGADVTAQYAVTEKFGDLEILPITITVSTESAKKMYDGNNLSAKKWEHVDGTLLPGHTLDMSVTAVLDEVGVIPNAGHAKITDQGGKDVSGIYQIDYKFGTLEIQAIPLAISTGSAEKVYDGTPLVCEDWTITGGTLEQGAVIKAQQYSTQEEVGSMDNVISFLVFDENGVNITNRYSITCSYGTLNMKPKAITIRTGSDQKVYDGTVLSCNEFEIVSGSLCENDFVSISCTSIVDVGYSENYVLECSIYRRMENGDLMDVTTCYRITFDYGMLKITAN